VYGLDGQLLAEERTVALAPACGATELVQALSLPDEPVVAELRALDPRSSEEIARDCAWTEPFRFYRLGGARITIDRAGTTLKLSADRPVKGLWLDADEGVTFADNFIDLVPGAPRCVAMTGSMPKALWAVALDHDRRSFVLQPEGGAAST
jgi:beta-mannosidase